MQFGMTHAERSLIMATTPRTESSTPVQKPYGEVILTLKNCLLPSERFVTTPSCLDGLEIEQETDLRLLGCELIQTAGILLRLPQVAMATGQILFQRFFHSKSFIKHSMEIVAMGCVCLASKIEEAPRRIRDVINVFHHLKQIRNKRPVQPLILDQNYINLKNQVIKAERRVLKELGFCVHVKHPHKIIVTYLQVLECEKNQKLIQTSWNYMNDSLRSDVFLRFHPEAVASACIHLSARQLKIPLPNRPPWYYLFGVNDEEVVEISQTILRLYTRHKPDGEKLEKIVQDIRKIQTEAKLKAKGILGNNTPQGAGFSPSSRPTSPKQEKSPVDLKKEKSKDDSKTTDHSPRTRETNHVKKRSRSPDSNKSGRNSRSSGSNSTSLSPKRKARTPPRGYKEARKSQSRSRSRSRSPVHERANKEVKRSSRTSHKRRRSRSNSRSYSRSPHRNASSSASSSKKSHHHHHHHHHHHKETKSRYKSRSRSRDRERERERNHRDHSRSRSRSFDKYKSSRKDRQNNRDNGHHRSRSRDRSNRR